MGLEAPIAPRVPINRFNSAIFCGNWVSSAKSTYIWVPRIIPRMPAPPRAIQTRHIRLVEKKIAVSGWSERGGRSGPEDEGRGGGDSCARTD